MSDHSPDTIRSAVWSYTRLALALGAAALMTASAQGYASSARTESDRGLRLGLVENRPGQSAGHLQGEVSRVLHDYGRFTLARITHHQEERLRAAGRRLRLFEEPDRVGIGYYHFQVPPGPAALPPGLTADQSRLERGTYLVKLVGPVTDHWLGEIGSLGGEVLTPIPIFSYLVRIAPAKRRQLETLPFVSWVGTYHPAYKLNPQLAAQAERGSLTSEPAKLNILVYRSGKIEGVVNRVRGMGGTVLRRSVVDFYETLMVLIPRSRALDLARIPDVYIVEPEREKELEDESSTQILAGQIDADVIPFRPALGEPGYGDWLTDRNLDGSNVTIGYADDGVLNSDPSGHLTGRVNESVCGSPGAGGHGQFGAATAGGTCPHTPEAGTGYLFGLGVAPGVNFINIPFLSTQSGCSADESVAARLTVTSTGPNGVRGTIQNNSWGAGRGDSANDVSYGSRERLADIIVRDADDLTTGNQPLISCFSAGNEGDAITGTFGDSPASLTSPHAAKNILTTGSSSVYRPSGGASNINDRSLFSSQGPTFDGRIKPDFMAPGGAGSNNVVAISSASVANFGASLGDGLHSLSAGTSFSTPQTAGASALLVQWWQRFSGAVPSPAVVKALLIHSSRDMQGGNVPEVTPNRREGWGRWNLGNLIEPGTPTIVTDGPLFRKTSGESTIYLDQSVLFGAPGQEYRLRVVPQDPGRPLRATLVWTDAPGAVDSCPSLVNDLDLTLVQNGAVVLRGNAFASGTTVPGGPTDAINNVEQVVQNDPSGFYTLTVSATSLQGDGIPGNGDPTDQDFALVLSNATPYTGPILSSAGSETADICSGTGSGGDAVIDPGETAVFSIILANTGMLPATGVTATLVGAGPGLTIMDGSVAYPNISAGGTSGPLASDTLSILVAEDYPCGIGINLVLQVATDQGVFAIPLSFEVGATVESLQALSGSTGTVEDDRDQPTDFTTPVAATGTIRSVAIDLDITSTGEYLFNNYSVELISPQGTSVLLHDNPLPCMDLITGYPGLRLPQSGTLDLFRGENAGGAWTLRVTDLNNVEFVGGGAPRPASEATVNPWTLHLVTGSSAACNTCSGAVVAPPEVSGPGSGTPLTIVRDTATGTLDLAWENQGSLSDSYRLYQGGLSDLVGTGVTPLNTAPTLCGITTPGTSLLPDPGDLYYLVAGQKGASVGSLGESSDPAAWPRAANDICP